MNDAAHQQVIEIRPSRGLFDLDLAAVWRYRELLIVLMMRDVQVLYKQAALGAGWAILQPVFSVAVFTLIFGHFARMPSGDVPYPLFAFSGLLPWSYFAEATRRASTGLVNDANLIQKIYFPRIIMPLANAITPLVDFCIAFLVLVAMMVFYEVMPTWRLVLIPALLVVALMLALSIGLWLAPINVRFRDVKHTLPFAIQIWMYACPIVYPISIVPEQWRWAYSLNPMVGVIEGFRWAVLGTESPDLGSMAISGGVIVVLLASGLIFFRRMERSFADLI